jgi:hypothetical protein
MDGNANTNKGGMRLNTDVVDPLEDTVLGVVTVAEEHFKTINKETSIPNNLLQNTKNVVLVKRSPSAYTVRTSLS